MNIVPFINEVGNCVSLLTEDVPYYAEWIKGQGADICLYRAMDDHRVIGANLPLCKLPEGCQRPVAMTVLDAALAYAEMMGFVDVWVAQIEVDNLRVAHAAQSNVMAENQRLREEIKSADSLLSNESAKLGLADRTCDDLRAEIKRLQKDAIK